MTGILTAAVVVVGLLCLLDLLLTVGVIRRLREHTNLLKQVSPGRSGGLPDGLGMAAGERVAEFVATDIDGEVFSREVLGERTMVGFFAPGCQPCAEQLPRFIEHAKSMPERSLAVVLGGEGSDGHTEYVERLAPAARVVVEAADGPMQRAFQVSGYPTLYLLGADGVVAAVGMSTELLDHPAEPSAAAPAVGGHRR